MRRVKNENELPLKELGNVPHYKTHQYNHQNICNS